MLIGIQVGVRRMSLLWHPESCVYQEPYIYAAPNTLHI